MSERKKLSATMAIALAEMQDHGGELVRWQGGFWSYSGCDWKPGWPTGIRVPNWYVSATAPSSPSTRNRTVHHVTERAVLVSDTGDNEDAVWLPLSQIEIEPLSKGTAEITMPEWLAADKGLI
jgi:hypothetical protein